MSVTSQLTSAATSIAVLTLFCACAPVIAADEASESMTYFKNGNFKEAQRGFENLTLMEPLNSRAAYYLALTHLRQNHNEIAERQFRMIIDKFPRSYEAQVSAANLRVIEAAEKAGKSATTNPASLPAKSKIESATAATTVIDARVQKDFDDAQIQAVEIKKGAAQRAQYYLDQAKQKASEMRQVMIGRQFARPEYSNEAIEAATADLKKQAAIIIESGNNEANDLLSRAKMRRDAQSH